jgi:hypothetical protein
MFESLLPREWRTPLTAGFDRSVGAGFATVASRAAAELISAAVARIRSHGKAEATP